MDLAIQNIIVGPIVTDKAYKLNTKFKKLVIEVHVQANKIMIKDAIELLFNVKVEKVHTIIRQRKKKISLKRHKTFGKKRKRAIVTLKEGYNIDAFEQGKDMGVVADTHVEQKRDQAAQE